MSFCYLASFDMSDARHGHGTITFKRSGYTDFVVDLSPGGDVDNLATASETADGARIAYVYNHYSDHSWADVVGVDSGAAIGIRHSVAARSFSEQMTEWMRVHAASSGWPNPHNLSCTFSTSTLRYTFTYTGGTFTEIEFSNNATQDLFGFTAEAFHGGSATIAGQTVPMFGLQPELAAVSTPGVGDGIDYEPHGISASSVTAMGIKFGFVRSSVPGYRDWTQQSEPAVKTFRFAAQQANADNPNTPRFSHQELRECCRTVHPFVVVNGFGDGINYLFRLRAEGCLWSASGCARAASDMDDAHFDVRYQAQTLGVFT